MLLELPQVAITGTTSLGIAPWLYFSWRLLLDCKAGPQQKSKQLVNCFIIMDVQTNN